MHHPKLKDTTEQVKDSQSPYQSWTPTGPGGAAGEPQSQQKHATPPPARGGHALSTTESLQTISVSTDPL